MTKAVRLEAAQEAAGELMELLAPSCERIAIAGSVRRRKTQVKDLELVALPRVVQEPASGLWSDQRIDVDLLERRLAELLEAGVLVPRDVEIQRADGTVEVSHRKGPSYQALVYKRIPVDLFIVRPPAEWGVIFALRTGPYDWNIRLVNDARTIFRRVQDGRVLHMGKPVPCPEEADFFAALGQRYLEPWERNARKVRLDPRRAVDA